MKVKMIHSIAGHAEPRHRLADFSFAPGSVVELSEELGNAWTNAGIAIPARDGDELTMPVEAYTLKADEENPRPESGGQARPKRKQKTGSTAKTEGDENAPAGEAN